MPSLTATTEAVSASTISLKASASLAVSPTKSVGSTLSALRSLYPRAAKAFLQRNVPLTDSLLTSAFSLIEPPPSIAGPDPAASQRRKWEILRITFETTLYSSPPARDSDDLPSPVQANLMLSPEPFIATIHTRSLQLFTPAYPPQKPTSAFLPAQILVTLALASLKLGCTIVGRGMIEDWLARHGQAELADGEGYAKVLELYCLHVLPRLEDWDYAEDFLQYERELSADTRQYMITSVRTLRARAAAAQRAASPTTPKGHLRPIPDITPRPSRSVSPAPSTSSTSSGSTHTATPTTPHPGGSKGKAPLHAIARLTPAAASGSSQSLSSTATSRTVTPALVERQRSRSDQRRRGRHAMRNGAASTASSLPRAPRAPSLEPLAPRPPTALAVLRSSVGAIVQRASRTRLTAYVLLLFVFPLLSLVFRVRRRRPAVRPVGNGGGGTVAEVRRRLSVEGKGVVGQVVLRVWEELVRAVGDTVHMGGRGLV
ncbi:hypothetical protein IEO21_08056 [Rhodonia placenta]|uniref:Uncharacterized protein n=3 Tax=Rhodonia placenta TaxID=104341 RepID=A0A8H7TZK5_9APHY|nr:hypothetical protein IEO21_08056 [Postia placenta]